MKRFGFNAFIVDDENHEAYGACRGVARLETQAPVPIVLVGEHGSGKTHLLCAIANDVRASIKDAGIVCIGPDSFPDEARKLADDPRPVDLAQKAVLLVDDLDRFDSDLRLLGKIVRLFAENDHSIVFSSRLQPDRLDALPQELRGLLEKARIIEISPGDTQRKIALAEQRICRDSEEIVARQNREIDDLKARLDRAYPSPASIEAEGGDVQVLRDCVGDLTADLSESRERLTKLDEEIEDLKAENALLSGTSHEKEILLGATSEDADDAYVEDDESLRQELEAARADAKKAREEAQGMLQRAEELAEQMQENRNDFVKAQEEQAQQLSEIERLEHIFARTEGESGGGEPENAEGAPETASRDDSPVVKSEELQAELVALREERDTLQRERKRLEESIVRTHSERDTMKSLLERARNELDETRRDLEGVKQGSAEHAQTEQARMESLRQLLDESRAESVEHIAAQRMAGEELMALRSQLVEDSERLERLVSLLGVGDAEGGASNEKEAPPDSDPPEEAPEPMGTIEKRNPEDAILRPDFGEGARQSAAGSSTLHHVEELGSRPDPAVGGSTEEKAHDEDMGPPQSHHKSA